MSVENGTKIAKSLGAEFVAADVTKRSDWENLLKKSLETYGGLDAIVNNAGTTYSNKPTEGVTDAEFDLVFNVNVKSIYLSTSVLLPYFLENTRPGCFVQIASTAGIRPRPGLTWYNSSKAAVINASKTMAVEYGPKKIRFNSVCPVVGSTGL
jgi:NAD(P)-dependent dehydrogenase (short-subunit alcohol dehydrogenase family)